MNLLGTLIRGKITLIYGQACGEIHIRLPIFNHQDHRLIRIVFLAKTYYQRYRYSEGEICN